MREASFSADQTARQLDLAVSRFWANRLASQGVAGGVVGVGWVGVHVCVGGRIVAGRGCWMFSRTATGSAKMIRCFQV